MQGQIDTPTQRHIPIRVLAQEIPGRNGEPIHWMTVGRMDRAKRQQERRGCNGYLV